MIYIIHIIYGFSQRIRMDEFSIFSGVGVTFIETFRAQNYCNTVAFDKIQGYQ